MPKFYLESNVLEEAKKRVVHTFDNFKKIYVSFSAGKDSTVAAAQFLFQKKACELLNASVYKGLASAAAAKDPTCTYFLK